MSKVAVKIELIFTKTKTESNFSNFFYIFMLLTDSRLHAALSLNLHLHFHIYNFWDYPAAFSSFSQDVILSAANFCFLHNRVCFPFSKHTARRETGRSDDDIFKQSLHSADTPSHLLQVSNTHSASAPASLSITHTHTQSNLSHCTTDPYWQIKETAYREGNKSRECRPPVPAEAACQLGKARWKQSHMMAAVVVVEGSCCCCCLPSWFLLTQPLYAGRSCSTAMRWVAEITRQRRVRQLLLPQSRLLSVRETPCLPRKHGPSAQQANLIMGGAAPPTYTDTALTSSTPPPPSLFSLIDRPHQTRTITMSAPGSSTSGRKMKQFIDMDP